MPSGIKNFSGSLPFVSAGSPPVLVATVPAGKVWKVQGTISAGNGGSGLAIQLPGEGVSTSVYGVRANSTLVITGSSVLDSFNNGVNSGPVTRPAVVVGPGVALLISRSNANTAPNTVYYNLIAIEEDLL